jgi:cytochrome P450
MTPESMTPESMTPESMTPESITIADLHEDPHPILARLRREHPVTWVPALNGWLVTGREQVVQVMRDSASFTVDDPRFSTAQVIGPSMLSLDGAGHGRHREPFAAAFRPAEIRRRFTDIVTSEVQKLIAAMARSDSAELRTELAGPLSVAVVAAALGLTDTDPDLVLGWYAAIVSGVNDVSAGQRPNAHSAAAFTELGSYVQNSLREQTASSPRQKAPRSLLGRAAAGGLSEREVIANAAVLMFGGIETTEAMICNLAVHLLSDRQQCQRVRDDPSLLEHALTESLRLEPAAANIDRYATCDVTLAGARIARGELVIASIAAANRDPKTFAEPDRFDIGRENADLQVAFAQGPHFCLGIHLARLEAVTALSALLHRFDRLRLTEPSPARGLVFRKPATVWVAWDADDA